MGADLKAWLDDVRYVVDRFRHKVESRFPEIHVDEFHGRVASAAQLRDRVAGRVKLAGVLAVEPQRYGQKALPETRIGEAGVAPAAE